MATTRANRVAVDENRLRQAGKDVDTGKSPGFTLNAPYVFEVTRVVDGQVASIADWSSVRLQVTSQCDKGGDRYLDRTQATLNKSVGQSQWESGTDQVVFSFTAQDMNFALEPCNDGPLYYVLTATRTDGQVVPVGQGSFNVERAYQLGSNLELSRANQSFPQLAFDATYSEGPGSVAILPGPTPNRFTFAFALPRYVNTVPDGIDGGTPFSLYNTVFDGGTP